VRRSPARGAVTFSSASHPFLTIGRCGKRVSLAARSTRFAAFRIGTLSTCPASTSRESIRRRRARPSKQTGRATWSRRLCTHAHQSAGRIASSSHAVPWCVVGRHYGSRCKVHAGRSLDRVLPAIGPSSSDKNATATPSARSCQGGPGPPGVALLRKSSAGALSPRARSSHARKDKAQRQVNDLVASPKKRV